MADLDSLDIPTLQNMLNGASTYDERAAIRKAIRQQRAKGSQTASSSAKSSAAPATSYYRSGGARGTATASPKVSQYQYLGGAGAAQSKTVTKTSDLKRVKPQPKDATSQRKQESSELANKFASRSTSRTDMEQRAALSAMDAHVGLKSANDTNAKKHNNDDEVPAVSDEQTFGTSNAKIEDAVTVVTKEVDDHDTTEESVDEVQASQDELEVEKNVGEVENDRQMPGRCEERSEVEVDVVVTHEHQRDVSDIPAGSAAKSHLRAVETGEESDASSTVSAAEVAERRREQTTASAAESEHSAQSSVAEFEEDEEEEAIERQIQATLSYTERKELRARLRQLRKSRKPRSSRGVSESSVSSRSQTTDAAPSTPSEPSATSEVGTYVPTPAKETSSQSQPQAQAQTQDADISIEEVDSGCCLLVESSNKDGDASPAVKSADLSPMGDRQSELAEAAAVQADNEQEDTPFDDTSSQASSTSDSSERRYGKSSSGDEVRAALSQSEGVSDFRTVLKKGGTASPAPQRKAAAGGEQKDFRTVLKKNETPAPAVVSKTGKTPTAKAEQVDFRSQLRKSVKTKDRSSAAPRRDDASQEDFRKVLKRGESDPATVGAAQPPKPAEKKSPPLPTSAGSARAEKEPVPVPEPVKGQAGEDETDGLGSSRMTVSAEKTSVSVPPAAKSEPETKTEEAKSSGSAESKAVRDLLSMDPLDPSLTYDERREIRRLQREARAKGGSDSSRSTPQSSPDKKLTSSTDPLGKSYEETKRLRAEAKRQEEAIRRKQRQQFTAQLNASSPTTSPNRQIVRNSGAQQLLEWCRRRTMHYENVEIKDFRSSWKNGLAFAALMSSLCPNDDIPYDDLTPESAERNLQLAFDASEKNGLPPMLDVEDMMICAVPDEKSIMTYVSSIYKHFT